MPQPCRAPRLMHPFRAIVLLLLAACGLAPQPARALREVLDTPPESLRAVIVTIDGVRKSEFMLWNSALLAWADSAGAYISDLQNVTRGKTDPNHAILWGSGDPGQCNNYEGHPDQPMHTELLRWERGLPEEAVCIVTGKDHLVVTNCHSDHPDFGSPYRATTIVTTSPVPPCMAHCQYYEGPDSLTMNAAIDFLAVNDVRWMAINLAEYDQLAHIEGLICSRYDTVAWMRSGPEVGTCSLTLIR
ncbi:MAG: hypothetical protein FJY75_08670 [Candidatus Eisenbacteria bacterium]|uniref:Alkaline phosphatase family protein n=1 Tax=Eiseniibacteriota bacterium TaxID=2212470 RepID=A0A937XBE7_UNCEI|nr:hypothetical protein [Candidatus Eisenbacteria bacterium]